jgi:hypothetical protein
VKALWGWIGSITNKHTSEGNNEEKNDSSEGNGEDHGEKYREEVHFGEAVGRKTGQHE